MISPGPSYHQVLRLPGVANLLLAACWSRLAGGMFSLAIILYTLGRFDSPALAGWVSFMSMAPGMLVSPLAGALLDRMGAARAITIDLMVGAAVLTGLVLVHAADALTPPLLLALVAFYSLTRPLGSAGIRTLIPRLVPAHARDRANALDTSSYALVDVLGPVMAGLLFGFAGASVALLAIVTLYVAAALSLVPVIGREPAPTIRHSGGLIDDAMAGLLYVLRHRSLRGLAVSYSLYQMSFGILLVVVPVAVTREVETRSTADSIVGLMWALSGIAGSLGALYAGHIQVIDRERWFIAWGTLATAVAIYPLGAYLGLLGLGLGLAIIGLLAGPIDVGVLTLRQRRTDPAWLGRALAVSMSLNMCGLPIGAALGGMLVTYSLPLTLAVAAAVSVLSAAAIQSLVPARSEEHRS
jgi:predicted MFS family arabinose efflux permease